PKVAGALLRLSRWGTGRQQRSHLSSDLEILTRAYDGRLHGGVGRAQHRVRNNTLIGSLVDHDAEKGQPRGRGRAERGSTFADAPGEDERVEATQRCSHRSDSSHQSVDIDIDGKLGVTVLACGLDEDLAHVRRACKAG